MNCRKALGNIIVNSRRITFRFHYWEDRKLSMSKIAGFWTHAKPYLSVENIAKYFQEYKTTDERIFRKQNVYESTNAGIDNFGKMEKTDTGNDEDLRTKS